MIKAVIFDLGSVIIYPDWNKINEESIKKTGVSVFKPKGFEHKYNELSKGLIKPEEYFELLIKVSGKKYQVKEFTRIYNGLYKKYTRIDERVLSLIEKLSNKFITVCLSDTNSLHYEIHLERDTLRHFMHKFFSFSLGSLKRENSFLKVLKEIKLKPEDCLFIDDNEENVKVAESVGIKVIKFVSYEDLVEKLKEFKVI